MKLKIQILVIVILMISSCSMSKAVSNELYESNVFDFNIQIDNYFIDNDMFVGDVINMFDNDIYKCDIKNDLIGVGDYLIFAKNIDVETLNFYKNGTFYFAIEYFNPYSYEVDIEHCRILNIKICDIAKNNCYFFNGIGYNTIITYNLQDIYDLFNKSNEEYVCEKKEMSDESSYCLEFSLNSPSSRIDYCDETETVGFNNIKKYVFMFNNNDKCTDFYIDNYYDYFWIS